MNPLGRCVCALFLAASAICAAADWSFADTRVALVIGNGAYQNAPRLPNPANDAAGVAAALKRAGFDTILATDLSKAGMDEATIRFARAARTAGVAIFYYSGHALQFAGVNYLAPIDIDLKDETDLRRMTRVDDVVADLAKAKNLRILVLDSCRDNPLADQLKRSIGASRALPLQHGLAKIDSPEGMIVAYATQAGRTAEDGGGKNSPYTTAFLKHIDEKEEIGSIFRRISADVYETTKHEQLPELSLSLIGEFYLNGKVEVTTIPAPADPCAAAADHWKSAEAIGTKEAFEDHLARFPTCIFAGLAKARINALNAKVAAVAPSAAPTPAPASRVEPSQPSILGGLTGNLFGKATVGPTSPAQQEPAFPPVQKTTNPPPRPPAAEPPDTSPKLAVVAPPVAVSPPPSPCGGASVTASLSARGACPLSAAEERALKPQDSFKECDTCTEMVVVPTGSFNMGSPKGETGHDDSEAPQHEVTIARPFAVGRFPVTFEEWDACVADRGCNHYKPKDEGWGRGRRPVINVSWDDAKAYVTWVSRKTGKPYRLLTEAEREYVARAGTTTPFWWGVSIDSSQANYNGNGTVPVDSYVPNPWGLFQVHGNVYDWVEDCYHENYAGAPTDGSAWVSRRCGERVNRGGGWGGDGGNHLRAAGFRNFAEEYTRGTVIGFRLARTLSR